MFGFCKVVLNIFVGNLNFYFLYFCELFLCYFFLKCMCLFGGYVDRVLNFFKDGRNYYKIIGYYNYNDFL